MLNVLWFVGSACLLLMILVCCFDGTCLFVERLLIRSEINIRPWSEEFPDIKRGSKAVSWKNKIPRAYWKGNPDVSSPIRTELLNCNHSRKWGAQIMRQVWVKLPFTVWTFIKYYVW